MKTLRKHSRQREELLKVLRGTKSHPTAGWVFARLKNKFPRLSLGTVYRNLNLLRDEGKVQELAFGSTFDRFDGNPLPHYHFICEKCGRVFDINLPVENTLNKKAEKAAGFKVDRHRVEFFGRCRNCLIKGGGEN
ncbi:transcriptional repressor [candidate division WOR-1 bacterium RIFCSPHIGHO2_01_FULL_53_15]|uniref:Transcriptional repressor n=1 Tax=candidate division WOR-1 bacterium RIFCSPHIGHO2_01_FULL_53_15 TaxID=1802564 RepID=A0A1F4Q3N0_UNCSA|nr:MAG: transcriptional repressor [candidate division WOR-1 bacterium RIFCSPHIGHO2_01_FULL_53_15]OGC12718.1 MAG: transcriptional repressor [candidate division WOR-1 bacterium RIFCSPHIGHO2_02_FULL_53_26]